MATGSKLLNSLFNQFMKDNYMTRTITYAQAEAVNNIILTKITKHIAPISYKISLAKFIRHYHEATKAALQEINAIREDFQKAHAEIAVEQKTDEQRKQDMEALMDKANNEFDLCIKQTVDVPELDYPIETIEDLTTVEIIALQDSVLKLPEEIVVDDIQE